MKNKLKVVFYEWALLARVVAQAGMLSITNISMVGGNPQSPPSGMVLIPAGSFQMGDNLDEESPAPVHTVYVSAFCMDKYDVTKALWDEVYNWATNHSYTFDSAGSGKTTNHPVQTINWYDCVKWCNARSEKEGRTPAYYTNAAQTAVYRSGTNDLASNCVNWSSGYRLPTEAEWEKAARGGLSGQRFPWGNTISWVQANYRATVGSEGAVYPYDVNSTQGHHPTFNDGVYPYTSPVGYFAPNGYGLYDMAGNVWQWCWDWYGGYSSGSQTDPRGPSGGSVRASAGSVRAFRGGSWYFDAFGCRVAGRTGLAPGRSGGFVGFRTALSPAPRPQMRADRQ